MGFRGRLEITDGTTFIDLLGNSGGSKSIFGLLEWEPAAPDIKDGGIWMDNPLLDGRQLAIRKESNIIETFSLVAKGQNATDVLNAITELRSILNAGVGHWLNSSRYPSPVYLLIQYPEETQPYWALIYDYRLPQLTNPYIQPLYQAKKAIIPEFTLVIERGYRSPITGISCASFDTTYELTPLRKWGTFGASASTDDIGINWTAGTVDTGTDYVLLGQGASGEQGYAGRFRNVTIPAGVVIKKAYLSLTPGDTKYSSPDGMHFAVELNVAPAAFSTYANFIGRTWSSEYALDGKDITTMWTIDTPGAKLTNAGGWEAGIQSVIDLPGWASGNDIAFYVRNRDLGPTRSMYTFDSITAAWRPYLYIEWERTVHEITITNSVCLPLILGNKDPYNSIGDVFVYDDSAGTYTNLKAVALPWTLLPAIPAANDALYVACNYVDDDPQDEPFSSLVFNLSTPVTLGNIRWQYWNGAAWTNLTCFDLTSSFRNSNQGTVSWTVPTNWARNAVNGITAFWVRALVVAAPTGTPVQASKLYQSLRPYIDILLETYENPVRYKLQISPLGSMGTSSDYSIDHAFICGRVKSRGEDFSPFINLCDTLMTVPYGIVITHPLGTDTALNTAPTGRAIQYAPGGVVAETTAFVVGIHSDISNQYSGKFRVFLRRYATTNPENMSYRLTVSNDPTGLSSNYYRTDLIADTTNPSFGLVDFGVVDLTTFSMNYNDVYLTVSSAASAASSNLWIDLILLPVDDAMVEIYQRIGVDVTSWFEGYYNRLSTIDSTVDHDEQAYMQDGNNIITKLMFRSNAEITMPVNKDMRFWFLFGGYITGCTNYQRRYHPELIAGITLQVLLEKI